MERKFLTPLMTKKDKKIKMGFIHVLTVFFIPLLGFSLSILRAGDKIFFLTIWEIILLIILSISIGSKYSKKNLCYYTGSFMRTVVLALFIFCINGNIANIIVLAMSLSMTLIILGIWLKNQIKIKRLSK
ncbi:hypothetical protein BHS01_06145 [Lactococcus paracarnosus]|uniref:Uncharacterized protein n=1 Tax=Pseudolactococcus paracarnosus TaxID=2749962 RepID=A0A7L4WF76_9LACT|nr:hypothetical protein BHS01_06145 [Lactococcus paracarnosus]